MTTKEAVEVVGIMIHHVWEPGKLIASFLHNMKVDLVEFFNEADETIPDHLHDQILALLEQLKRLCR